MLQQELPTEKRPEKQEGYGRERLSCAQASLALPTESPRDNCIHQLFEEQVQRTPGAVAVVFEDTQLSYGELNRRANQLANYLRKRGVGPEVLVGICVERSLEMVVGLLGILKAGGAYVPLDPAYPDERLSFMLKDAKAGVILTQRALEKKMGSHQVETIALDADWQKITNESDDNPDSHCTPENLAYVIYTSGSTGRPKGVSVSHSSVVHLVRECQAALTFGIDDVWTTVHSYAFDLSVWEIFGALLSAGRLVVVPLSVAQSPSDLLQLLRTQAVTILSLTPSAARHLLDVINRISSGDDLSLRRFICGGEALPSNLAAELLELKVPLWNFYGPTESTVWATIKRVEPENLPGGAISIGRAICDLETYILDQNLGTVSAGLEGELHLGGPGLARGYLNRPGLTAERFVPNAFGNQPGARLYKTGDLARFLPDGNIEYLGRIDHQVKVRGYRIELGEIEAALEAYPGIEKSVLMAREDQPGSKRLVAYIVPRPEATLSVSVLRSYLKEKLPEYMVPAIFLLLEAFPLTPNGKIDRRALPSPDETRPLLDGRSVAPRDPTEFQLVSIWENLLGIQPVGVLDNFFEIGGDSLLAVRLFAQIKEAFGESLHLATLFQAPTIDELARIIGQHGGSESWPSLVAIQPSGSKPPLYCVHNCGGNVLMYRPLARQLSRLIPDQPLYGLQAQGMDGKRDPHTRIEEMAAHYVKEIRDHQPEGPYYLLGDTWGGIIVFEIARLLDLQGQKVAMLAMMDTLYKAPHSNINRIRDHMHNLIRSGLKAYAVAVARGIRSRIVGRSTENGDTSVAHSVIESASVNGSSPDDPIERVMNMIGYAYLYYAPPKKPYPGRITYFFAKDEKSVKKSERLHWRRKAAGGLEVHEIPGSHDNLKEDPQVAVVAEKLAVCLQSAQSIDSVVSLRTWKTFPKWLSDSFEKLRARDLPDELR